MIISVTSGIFHNDYREKETQPHFSSKQVTNDVTYRFSIWLKSAPEELDTAEKPFSISITAGDFKNPDFKVDMTLFRNINRDKESDPVKKEKIPLYTGTRKQDGQKYSVAMWQSCENSKVLTEKKPFSLKLTVEPLEENQESAPTSDDLFDGESPF